MFTLDTESGFRDVVFITAAYGLGETVVQGSVNPDEFYVHKPMLARTYPAVVRRELGEQAHPHGVARRRHRDRGHAGRSAPALFADRQPKCWNWRARR